MPNILWLKIKNKIIITIIILYNSASLCYGTSSSQHTYNLKHQGIDSLRKDNDIVEDTFKKKNLKEQHVTFSDKNMMNILICPFSLVNIQF